MSLHLRIQLETSPESGNSLHSATAEVSPNFFVSILVLAAMIPSCLSFIFVGRYVLSPPQHLVDTAADRMGNLCPKCRQEISNRRSYRVNIVLWNTIQLIFPEEVEARKVAAARKISLGIMFHDPRLHLETSESGNRLPSAAAEVSPDFVVLILVLTSLIPLLSFSN
ncbi:unnamed protein product [Fraxinus pennsylvanica]|uniref:RING-type E3 ubiquitin transferase n=1 Tax=Fraxinus pennsylvanica TaxID=56036 RepID=A0AAD2DNR4_9LAMI|nr:unnamed protein product [Fraxinus pennsylvanica]